jgi:hypothetical protein
MYKFNASFRKSAVAVGEALGLEFISSKRQVENGTLMFNDPQSNVKYALYESGYVRRLTPLDNCPWGNSQTINERGHAMYQLNKVRKEWKQVTSYTGKTYSYYQNVRILANPEEQLGILVKSVVNWRNNKY